jgi:Domain of unknown function (DUF4340)
MKMKQLLILVGAVIVLWAVFILMDQSKVPTAEDNYLVDIDTTEVTELEIMTGGTTITLTRRDDGSWYITNPVNYRANRRYMSQLLEKLDDMRIESEVTSKRERWPEFELDTAGVSLTVRQGSQEDRVVLGKAAESYRQSYARYADKENVYMVNGTYSMVLSRTVDNWRDKEMFNYEQHNIVGIKTDEWSLARNGDQWSMTADGSDIPVDPSAAARIQSQISRMRTSGFPTAEELAGADFSADPANTVNVSLDNGELMEIRFYLDPENERRYLVRMDDDETTYTLFEGIYNQIFTSVEDLTLKPPADPAMEG